MAPSWNTLFDSNHSGMLAAPALVATAGNRMPATAVIATRQWMSSACVNHLRISGSEPRRSGSKP